MVADFPLAGPAPVVEAANPWVNLTASAIASAIAKRRGALATLAGGSPPSFGLQLQLACALTLRRLPVPVA